VRYSRQKQKVKKNGIQIGRIPIMLRSEKCVLNGKSDFELAQMKECKYDTGGYFICKGVEKVILMQEQLSKVRHLCSWFWLFFLLIYIIFCILIMPFRIVLLLSWMQMKMCQQP